MATAGRPHGQSGGLTPTIHVRRNVSAPASTSLAVQFATSAQSIWTIPSLRQSMPWDNLRVADLNGDGRADIVALTFNSSDRNPKFFATPLLSNGFGNAFTVGAEKLLWQESMVTMADWNADGCSDILQVRAFSSRTARVRSSTRDARRATGNTLYTALPADWNGDSRADLLSCRNATVVRCALDRRSAATRQRVARPPPPFGSTWTPMATDSRSRLPRRQQQRPSALPVAREPVCTVDLAISSSTARRAPEPAYIDR
jgi:hypothetical protein